MNFEFVEIMTKQKLKLFGCFSRNNNARCILYIPGLTGNFFESKFARILGENLKDAGFDYLFSHNQGSFQVIDFPYLREDGKLKTKTKGAAYEVFEDCVYDIDAWVNYLKNLNYKEIVVICHSMGCNKIIYYLNKVKDNSISNIILLSPQDNINFANLEMHAGLLEEAKKNIETGNGDKLISKKFLGFCLMSSDTYYQEITNPNINNIPYKTKNGNFKMLFNIDKPIYTIIGSEDGGENSIEYMEIIIKHCKSGRYDVIEGANHTFKNKEKELSSLIINYLNS